MRCAGALSFLGIVWERRESERKREWCIRGIRDIRAIRGLRDGGGSEESEPSETSGVSGMVVYQSNQRDQSHQRSQVVVGEEFDFSDFSGSSDSLLLYLVMKYFWC